MRNVALGFLFTAIAAIAAIALYFLDCIFEQSAKTCVRQSVKGVASTIELLIVLALSVWLGVEAARRYSRPWLGWVIGISIFVALAFILAL